MMKEYGLTEPRNRTDRSPLIECGKNNRLQIIKKLLEQKPRSELKKLLDTTRDEDQMTCLHFASIEGKHACVLFAQYIFVNSQ